MSFWDRVAALYDITQLCNHRVQREMSVLVSVLIPDGARVLDTAAGTGVLSFAAAKRASEVVCTDLSLSMLDVAKKKAQKSGISNIRFEARNIFDLCDKNGAYDVTMAGNVLHLLDNPERAVKELCRVTKRGGLIILPTFMLGRRNGLVEVYKQFGFNPKTNYTPQGYRRMLENCGCGRVRARLIKGIIPCCFAVIRKDWYYEKII